MSGTTNVVDRLRDEGFRVSCGYVQWVLRDRHIAMPAKGPGGCLLWDDADVLRLRGFLYRRGRGPKGKGAASGAYQTTGNTVTGKQD